MSDNFILWEKHSDIDPMYTKPIEGKDYKGTSPNAHYIIQCLTDLFGPVGKGFGWRVVSEGIEKFDETSIHWCRIEFWHTDRANVYESYGQTKMSYKARRGFLKVDEDAPKKSLTDAITKAASYIGIASNIFLGRWDDNKYVETVKQEYERKEANSELAWFSEVLPKVNDAEGINALLDRAKKSGDEVKRMVKDRADELELYYDRKAGKFRALSEQELNDHDDMNEETHQ